MKLIKDVENIADEDKIIALQVLNRLKVGDRVFGNVAEGLKETLSNLEKDLDNIEKNKNELDYLDNDGEIKSQIRMIKAGIKGEEALGEYFEKVVKLDDKLQDLVIFASLSDPDQNAIGEENGYIADSDFVAVYGNYILILDAKNITTSPELPIYLDGNDLVTVGGQPILELHPSTHIWKNIFQKNRTPYVSIHGCVVIVNKKGALVWKNPEWYRSEVKPIHISDLVPFLHEWIKDKDPETNLSILTTLAKMQIKKEESILDLSASRRRFGI